MEQSSSPSNCWEHVQLEKEWEKQHIEATGHMEHDGDCYDWEDDDSSWEESLVPHRLRRAQ
jgi:hypothetical protein